MASFDHFSSSVFLDVAVVGAGIAGLSAAIGLRRAGHQVKVFERSRFANEVGAAINLCPNASRILTKWGFDFERSKAVVVLQGRVLDSISMKDSYHGRYDDLVERFGTPWYFIHRVDLHNELKRLAQDLGVDIQVSSEVTHVDCENAIVTLANGQTSQKDLIIAADGVHSILTGVVEGTATKAYETGQSAFRFMIPTQKIRDAGLSGSLRVDEDVGINIATHSARRLVWYPCKGGDLLNLVAIHPDRNTGNEVQEAWDVAGRLNDLLDEYRDFHPDMVRLCGHAEDLKLWRLFYRPPISNWYKGKLALAGDAAHPMLPHQGQGGGQAIEDAGALSVLFSGLGNKNEIAQRLQMYQDVRKNRAASIQVLSNAGQDEAEKIKAEAQKYIDGHVPANQQEFHTCNFGHDVMKEAEDRKALAFDGSA